MQNLPITFAPPRARGLKHTAHCPSALQTFAPPRARGLKHFGDPACAVIQPFAPPRARGLKHVALLAHRL